MAEQEGNKPVVQGTLSVTDVFGLGAATKNLTPAVTEIIKAIGAGAGKVYEPASIYFNERAKGAAERHNALADAQAYLELKTRSPAVLEAMKERILGTEYRRQENILAAEAKAIKFAGEHAADSAHEIHPDFMAEWMEGVKDVSDDMVRTIWAHLLAEAPTTDAGRVPKPVVDFLKLLDSQLCQQLEALYRSAYATNGKLFSEVSVAYPMAEEIGIGSSGQVAYFETNDRTLIMEAVVGAFPVFEIGARANMLCEIAFPVVDEHASLKDFYESLPSVMHGLQYSNSIGQMTIEVRDAKNYRHIFGLEFRANEVVKPKYHADAAGVMRDMDLTGKACAEELRAAISQLQGQLEYRGSQKVHRLPL